MACEIIGTCPYNNHSSSGEEGWSPEDNLRQMQLTDDAYNAQDFSKFNHRDDTIITMPGELEFNMAQHIQDLTSGYAAFPDGKASNHPYKVAFGEGEWTVALTDAVATNTGPIRSPTGWRGPTHRSVSYEAFTFARWEGGRIVREQIWTDTITLNRQLGFFTAAASTDPTKSLTLSDYTLPLSTNPGADSSAQNKQAHRDAELAFSQGNWDAESLNLSPNATIFVSRDDGAQGRDVESFLALLESYGEAFNEFALRTTTVIGSGDWTATASRLSGTLTGTLSVPEYLSPNPIEPTGEGNEFEVWFYSIARWQDGEITHLKIMTDLLTILAFIQ